VGPLGRGGHVLCGCGLLRGGAAGPSLAAGAKQGQGVEIFLKPR
jgi:hypothetical protein